MIRRWLARRRDRALRRALEGVSDKLRYLEATVVKIDGVDADLITDINTTEESSS